MEKLYKIFVTTPESHTDTIINAMSEAGAGKVGNYTHCAFITKGYGNYMPNNDANPFIGEVGKMNRETEDKIEMICPKEKLEAVVQAIKNIHPYETPTIDVIEIMFFN
jgi:hypothetical protein